MPTLLDTPSYTRVLSVEAQAEYERLTPAQKNLVERGLQILEANPHNPATEDERDQTGTRRAALSAELSLRYGVHENFLVIAEIRNHAFLLGPA